MIPVKFKAHNAILAATQEEYEPLPVYKFKDREGRMACCFRLSPVELAAIAATGTIWIQQLTFGRAFQPICLTTQKPEEIPND